MSAMATDTKVLNRLQRIEEAERLRKETAALNQLARQKELALENDILQSEINFRKENRKMLEEIESLKRELKRLTDRNGDNPAATSHDKPPTQINPQPKSRVSQDPSRVRPATRPVLPDSEARLRHQRLQEGRRRLREWKLRQQEKEESAVGEAGPEAARPDPTKVDHEDTARESQIAQSQRGADLEVGPELAPRRPTEVMPAPTQREGRVAQKEESAVGEADPEPAQPDPIEVDHEDMTGEREGEGQSVDLVTGPEPAQPDPTEVDHEDTEQESQIAQSQRGADLEVGPELAPRSPTEVMSAAAEREDRVAQREEGAVAEAGPEPEQHDTTEVMPAVSSVGEPSLICDETHPPARHCSMNDPGKRYEWAIVKEKCGRPPDSPSTQGRLGADLGVRPDPAEVAEDGHRHLPALIKEEGPLLPDAREVRGAVVRRLGSLAKKVRRCPAYKGRCSAGMRDLRTLGCAVEVAVDEVGGSVAPSDQDVLLFPWCPDGCLDAGPKPCRSERERGGEPPDKDVLLFPWWPGIQAPAPEALVGEMNSEEQQR